MDAYFETNRKHWDELVGLHVGAAMYDVPGFKAGRDTLHSVEVEELGDVRGKSLLHMQCHFGNDTLSWARRGATATGVDFSEPAIEVARAHASEMGIDNARFVHSDIYSLPDNLRGQFDIVFTSYGTVFWLPDLARWAQVIVHFLRPGGVFYIVDFHPMMGVFEPAGEELAVTHPYFPTGEPLRFDDDGSYADRTASVQNRTTYTWTHPISETVTSLLDAGLRLDFLHEFPFTAEQWYPLMKHIGGDYWRLTKHDGCVPMLYSIRARKPVSNDV